MICLGHGAAQSFNPLKETQSKHLWLELLILCFSKQKYLLKFFQASSWNRGIKVAISYNIWSFFFAQNFDPLKDTQPKYFLLGLLIPLSFKLKDSSCFTITILLESCNFFKEYLSKSPKIGIKNLPRT